MNKNPERPTNKVTEEFFKRRFPNKEIQFEKDCGYFYEWTERFASGMVESFMDEESKLVWKQMQQDGFNLE